MRVSNILPAIFIYTLISSSSLIANQSYTPTNTTILDVEGQELQSTTRYYIFPFETPNRGGGLGLSSKDGTCPHNVMQETLESSNGLPLRLLTIDNKSGSINLSTDVNIAFMAATTCVQSTVWRVGGISEVSERRYVTSGGVVGQPGVNTMRNWFKVEKNGNWNGNGYGYKIVYCPSFCSSCRVACGNVGVFVENGKRWLGLTADPLLVIFQKA
ncbi:hypothetical protein Vadar_026257 [Vaccinium darrowii]|uniref:Uncharacterized protein n=1 Tax=Vaccinium darrowii TaxID=229202 RepID=A0ACB7XJZ7_9ERIC|nr:hypothetical protein Vadar_026257 [Vaccinium darrowii]